MAGPPDSERPPTTPEDTAPEDSLRDTVTVEGMVPRDHRPETPPPERIGRYVVLATLGGGAAGDVYAAYDPQLDRKVAVKLLKEDASADPEEMRERLFREAQTMARLAHPNVVTVYDVGVADERVFMAMELLDGTTLRRWQAGEHTWRERVRVYVAAGRGLAAAHALGIVHRDFKPDNVLISHGGAVKVTDFGIALGRPDVTAPDGLSPSPTSLVGTSLTEDGVIKGTPGYMAPEQYTGAETDQRTDQFCFCAALYEALFREKPFEGKTFEEQMRAVLEGHVRPPRRGARAPARLRRILLRGLSREPAERYPDLDALLADLERDPLRALRVAAAVAALVALAGGAALGAQRAASDREAKVCSGGAQLVAETWSPQVRETITRAFERSGVGAADEAWTKAGAGLDAYAKRWAAAHHDACEATRVRGVQTEAAMQLRMTCLEERRRQLGALARHLTTPDAETVARAAQAAYSLPDVDECSDVTVLTSGEPLPAAPAARAAIDDVRRDLGEVHAIAPFGHVEVLGPRLRALSERARATGFAPVEADVALELGSQLQVAGDAAAIDVYKDAILAAERGRSDDVKVSAESSLAHLLANRHRFDEAREWLALARATAVHADRRLEARLWKVEGWFAFEQDQFGKANEAFVHALRAYAEFYPRSPDYALLMSGAAMVALLAGDEARATSLSAASDALAIDLFGVGSAFRAGILSNRSALLLEAARYAEALAASDEALALGASLPPTQNRVMNAHFNRVESLIGLERLADARRELDAEVSALTAAGSDTEREDYGRRWRRLRAKVMVAEGDYAGARPLLRDLLAPEKDEGADAAAEALQAEVDLHTNAPREALAHAHAALEGIRSENVRTPARLEEEAEAQLLLAEALWASGSGRDEARRMLREISTPALSPRRRAELEALAQRASKP